MIGIGFAIAGLPSPVVFGVLAALLSLLPIGGAAFVWVPAVIWLLIPGSFTAFKSSEATSVFPGSCVWQSTVCAVGVPVFSPFTEHQTGLSLVGASHAML